MKFLYLDESGHGDNGGVFTMAGIMVDAYKLRKRTEEFDNLLKDLLDQHSGRRRDFKTSKFINGSGGWSKIDAQTRKDALRNICNLTTGKGAKIFCFAMDFNNFNSVLGEGLDNPFEKSYWLASAMFIMCAVQKKMQAISSGKGLTVAIFDDNEMEMPKLSDQLYRRSSWYDDFYMKKAIDKRSGKPKGAKDEDRFNQIINTAFAVKSEHSSLVQVADAIAYIYRRKLELMNSNENWAGEKEYMNDLFNMLEKCRQKMSIPSNTPCGDYYESIVHPEWRL